MIKNCISLSGNQWIQFWGGVKKIYFSPSGLLHRISFAAIKTPDYKFLSEKYFLIQLSSTRQLAIPKQPMKIDRECTAAIFGGIKYELKTDKLEQITKKYHPKTGNLQSSLSYLPDQVRGGNDIDSLPGTLIEADSIDMLFKLHKIFSRKITGDNATEEYFKSIGKISSPTILHVTTHGFFFPLRKIDLNNIGNIKGKDVFKYADNPLFRSGLLMAGANRVWKGNEPIQGIDDGILTAYEISMLNLSNTKLVVMSACNTGLGDISGSEGVFGLQRAFKMAGVDNIIMSLWKVPDFASMDFMITFYKFCLSGKDVREAFKLTQKYMQKDYQIYQWGAFVLVE